MQNKKILIVEDSKMMSKFLEDHLRGEGYDNLISASNGKEAIDMYRKESPDLILLDIIMPEMNGMEVLREIGKEAKIIVLSAIGQDSIISEAKAAGAVSYLVKPFDRNDIIAKVLPFLK